MTSGLRWDEIATDAWRVCDPERPGSEADGVLAYLERRSDGLIEVVWLCGSPGTHVFGSLGDAERAIEARYRAHRRAGSPSSSKPMPIAHRPPASTA